MHDRVHGTGFSYDCCIGFHEYERHIRQKILVDFEAETDWRTQARQDRAINLVDYFEANKAIKELVENKPYKLIEAMAEDIARLLCTRFSITRVRVKITKQPFDMPNVGSVAVECWRTPGDFR
jgi:dihydroneopterin aldolase